MARHISAPGIAIALAAVLAMTACSGGAAETTSTPPSAAVSTPASEAAPSSTGTGADADQSVAAACLGIAGPLSEAAEKVSEIATSGAANPQGAMEAWAPLVEAYGAAAEAATHPDVKAAVSDVRDDLIALRDAMQKVYNEPDAAAVNEVTTATAEWQKSQEALLSLCSG